LLWLSGSMAAVLAPVIVLALWVTRSFREARSLLAARHFDDAATELAAFEVELKASGWKRRLAGVAVGLYTSSPLAASRNTLGAVRLEQGRLADARLHFQAALELDPGYGVPWGNLALLAALGGDAVAAEAARGEAEALGFRPKWLRQRLERALKQGSAGP
jgi:tetratricopeptide (TPR) repeat protein